MPNPAATSPPEQFKGVINRLVPEAVPQDYVFHSQNYRMRTTDCVPRLGVIKPGWLNQTNAVSNQVIRSVDALYGAAVFKDPNGIEWVIQCSDGLVYRCRPHNERYALDLPAGVRILDNCFPVQAFNKVWLFRGRHLAPLVIRDLDTGVEDLLPLWDSATTYSALEEVAYGPFVTITAPITLGGGELVSGAPEPAGIATVNHTSHGFSDGASVVITGAVQTEYNGVYTITVVNANKFQYAFAGSATSPATGTIKIQLATVTSAAGIVTVTTQQEHGYVTGADLTVSGADQTEYNGRFNITVVDAYTFTYDFAGSATSPATGTIRCSNMSTYWSANSAPNTPSSGDSPESAASKWTTIYNILPNADDALYINNRLLVPTAYTPATVDMDTPLNGYSSSVSYTKKDFIVATDVLDDIHFDFANEFRINQGDDSEIVQLLKYTDDTVIVLKGKVWGILSGIALGLTDAGGNSTVRLDMRPGGYGACARGGVVVGKDAIFPVTKRGLMSLKQNELGKLNSTDIPFSDDVQDYVNDIDWTRASDIRCATWDDKLYWSVPVNLPALVGSQADYTLSGAFYVILTVEIGQWYYFDPGQGATLAYNSTLTSTTALAFRASHTVVEIAFNFAGTAWTGSLNRYQPAASWAILVYDFRVGAWQARDVGEPLEVIEFFKPFYNGVERLAFIGRDGWTNILEEAPEDQVEETAAASGLGWTPITTDIWSRGISYDLDAPKKFKRFDTVLQLWNSRFSLEVNTGAAFQTQRVRTDIAFSRTKYLKPFDKAPYVQGNANEDHATRGRGDYSVPLDAGGVTMGADGINPEMEQEITVRASVRTLAHRYMQFRLTSDRGRTTVMALATEAIEGQKRDNIIV